MSDARFIALWGMLCANLFASIGMQLWFVVLFVVVAVFFAIQDF